MDTAWFNDLWQRLRRGDPAAVGIVVGAIAVIVFLAWLVGRGVTPAARPPIPEEISRGPGREPRLKVYFHEAERVREMDLEDYLLGVVAGEMDPTWPLEALKAQAIIARTFTLRQIEDRGTLPGRDAHASTDPEEFQAYDSSRINDRVQQAIQETRGQVIVYNGQLAYTWFHAYSGGRTTTPELGLDWDKGETPYLQPVDDSDLDSGIPPDVQTWQATFSDRAIREAVQTIAGRDPGEIEEVKVPEWTEDGRARTLRFNQVEVPANAFRLAIGSTDFRSTMLQDIEVGADRVTFVGRGFGHGVGMSQWGARVMAERGQTAEDIILRYYRDVRIVRLWE